MGVLKLTGSFIKRYAKLIMVGMWLYAAIINGARGETWLVVLSLAMATLNLGGYIEERLARLAELTIKCLDQKANIEK